MDTLELFRASVGEFDRRVAAIRDDQWGDATPCAEWSVRDLVNHLVAEDLWAPLLLAGATLEDVGDRFDGDVLGSDPHQAWSSARDGALAAATDDVLAGSVHTSMGVIPADAYLLQLFSDHLVHAWDLARAIGGDERLPADLVERCYEAAKPYEQMMKGSGLFGDTIVPPPDASPQDELLALFGRRS